MCIVAKRVFDVILSNHIQPEEKIISRDEMSSAVKVKVSHSLIAEGAVGVSVPLYLGHS